MQTGSNVVVFCFVLKNILNPHEHEICTGCTLDCWHNILAESEHPGQTQTKYNFEFHALIQRGEVQTPGKLLAIGSLSNSGPDPPENHKATKPALNVGPPLARRRNVLKMAFRWCVDDGPF